MNVKRFTARTAREALALVRQALGDDAVVLSTRPCADGVEILALAPDGLARIEQAADQAERVRAPVAAAAPPVHLVAGPRAANPHPPRPASLAERIAARGEKLVQRFDPRLNARHDPSMDAAADAGRPPALAEPGLQASVARDVETLGMSTLTFQDYVRERMLKRRQAEITQQGMTQGLPPILDLPAALMPAAARPAGAGAPLLPLRSVDSAGPAGKPVGEPRLADRPAAAALSSHPIAPAPLRHQALRNRIDAPRREPPVLRDEIRFAGPRQHDLLNDGATRPDAASLREPSDRHDLMGELRSVRRLIDERFGMLAFMERLQRDPRQAGLSQKLFDAGLSPALVRKLVQSLPTADTAPDELAWAAGVLQRNLLTDEQDGPIEDHDGVLALIGPTGVGKTTSTAKLAAAFATKHGASQLGLITLDAYRVAAHEQLRTYGRILGVPVHTAHDRASLEDLLELLAGKKLVLIDTAGMAQRDVRTRELLDMLAHPAIHKLLVVNAATQGETVEDVMLGYGVQHCAGVIVSKLDEAVKLGPALDALIRHRCKVVGVANGQRVPEDWHRLTAQALVQRALRGGGGASWRLDAADVHLQFAATVGGGYPGPQGESQTGRHGESQTGRHGESQTGRHGAALHA